MNLNLSSEDFAEYTQRCLANEAKKQAATQRGDAKAAKKARQANTYLYQEFEKKQLPKPPLTPWEREMSMSLQDRIERIEQHLNIGAYK